jgi:hypothetical protein
MKSPPRFDSAPILADKREVFAGEGKMIRKQCPDPKKARKSRKSNAEVRRIGLTRTHK